MFNEKERKGILAVIFIIFIIAVITSLRKCTFSNSDNKLISNGESQTISLLELKNKHYKQKYKNYDKKYSRDLYNENDAKPYKIAAFDPNTVTESQLKEMGIHHIAASNWIKYLKKGGKFYKKEDLQKIFGLKPDAYEKISPYAIIKSDVKPSKTLDSASVFKTERNAYQPKKEKEKVLVDINTCTDLDLVELNGIGEKLSVRIIKYRDKLGGFVRIDQLKEVYGLPPETYELIKDQIIIDPKMIKKIKINLADAYILSGFPYIPRREAYQIVNYRSQHGNFRSIEDLKNIKSLDETFIQKIEPYLDFGE